MTGIVTESEREREGRHAEREKDSEKNIKRETEIDGWIDR